MCGMQEAHREEAQRRREVQAELFDLQGPVQVLCRLHNADDNSDDESLAHHDLYAAQLQAVNHRPCVGVGMHV